MQNADGNHAKILLFDLENSPSLGWTWEKYDTTVIRFQKEWELLAVGAKWLGAPGDPKVYTRQGESDDRKLTEILWKLMDEADAVVAHNARAFDVRKSNARFLFWDLGPPSPFQVVDTLIEARKNFALNSNTLGDLARYLGLPGKEQTGGFDLWLNCMNDDPAAWRTMSKYCKQDVRLLEQVFLKLLPYMQRLPNMALLSGKPDACPRCGAEDTLIVRGYRYTSVAKRVRYQCTSCQGYCAGRPIIKTDVAHVV